MAQATTGAGGILQNLQGITGLGAPQQATTGLSLDVIRRLGRASLDLKIPLSPVVVQALKSEYPAQADAIKVFVGQLQGLQNAFTSAKKAFSAQLKGDDARFLREGHISMAAYNNRFLARTGPDISHKDRVQEHILTHAFTFQDAAAKAHHALADRLNRAAAEAGDANLFSLESSESSAFSAYASQQLQAWNEDPQMLHWFSVDTPASHRLLRYLIGTREGTRRHLDVAEWGHGDVDDAEGGLDALYQAMNRRGVAASSIITTSADLSSDEPLRDPRLVRDPNGFELVRQMRERQTVPAGVGAAARRRHVAGQRVQ